MAADSSVLLIEDEPQIRRFVRSALESEGCRVFEAATGEGGGELVGLRIPSGTGIAGWVLVTRQPLVLSDLANDPRLAGLEGVADHALGLRAGRRGAAGPRLSVPAGRGGGLSLDRR